MVETRVEVQLSHIAAGLRPPIWPRCSQHLRCPVGSTIGSGWCGCRRCHCWWCWEGEAWSRLLGRDRDTRSLRLKVGVNTGKQKNWQQRCVFHLVFVGHHRFRKDLQSTSCKNQEVQKFGVFLVARFPETLRMLASSCTTGSPGGRRFPWISQVKRWSVSELCWRVVMILQKIREWLRSSWIPACLQELAATRPLG